MEKILFTNAKGQSIELNKSAPYILQFLDGTGSPETDIQMQKSPFQDGETYIDTILLPRRLTFEVAIMANSEAELFQYRQELARVFNPKFGKGILRYIYEGGEKEIQCVPDMAPVFPSGADNKSSTYQKTMFTVKCPSPFWEEITLNNIKLEDFVASFRFKFHFPVSFAKRGDSKTLVNSGDIETPIKVTFKGPVTNPQITNVSTGEFIKVNRVVPAGYSLVIGTEFGNKYVKLIAPDGIATNAFGYLDINSVFFGLDLGDNVLSFITEGGSPEVYIEYKNRYIGV